MSLPGFIIGGLRDSPGLAQGEQIGVRPASLTSTPLPVGGGDILGMPDHAVLGGLEHLASAEGEGVDSIQPMLAPETVPQLGCSVRVEVVGGGHSIVLPRRFPPGDGVHAQGSEP